MSIEVYDFIHKIKWDDLPADIKHQARRCLLDTLGAGIAAGADVILIPEIPYDLEKVQEVVAERSHRGRRFSIIAVAPQTMRLSICCFPASFC